MKKTTIFVLTLLMMLVIWSCSEHTVQPYIPAFANGRVVGSIHGVIADFCNHTLFDSGAVTISWVVDGELKSTVNKRLGYFIITGLNSGKYEITFSEAEDYAISRVNVRIPELDNILDCCPPTDSAYHHSVTQNIDLFQKNAGFTGRIYKQHNDLSTTVAQGVTVVADYTYFMYDGYDGDHTSGGWNVYPGKYTTITDADGYFTFSELPGTPWVIFYTMPYTHETVQWGPEFLEIPLMQNEIYTLPENIILSIMTPEPFIVHNNFINVYKFVISDNIFATFSKLMKSECFYVELSWLDGDYWEIVECVLSWDGDLTLTIDPIVNLLPGTPYRLILSGFSHDDHEFDEEYTFFTQMGIEFVSTNLERAQDIYDEFPIASDIEIACSMPINLSHPDAWIDLWDPDDFYVANTLSLSADMKTLIISHPENLEPDHLYVLEYRIYSNIPGDFIEGEFTFRTAIDLSAPGSVSGFVLNMGGNWNADWNTTQVTFRWNTMALVDFYYIFAKDNNRNTDHISIGEFPASDVLATQSGTVTLPAQFDYYNNDGIQTPFLHGTDVTYYITAWNAAGLGPLSGGITVSDGTNPSPLLSGQSSTADNSANATSKSITIAVTSSLIPAEYLSSVSSFSMAESGGEPTFVLPLSAISFTWNTSHYNKTGGTIKIVIPALSNASGDTITIKCVDTSGNTGAFSLTLF